MSGAYLDQLGPSPITDGELAGAVYGRGIGLGEYLATHAREGFEDSLPGTVLQEFKLGPQAEEDAAGRPRVDYGRGSRIAAAAASGRTRTRGMSEEAWKASPYWREGLDFDPFMTEDRARARAELADAQAWRDSVIARRQAGVFDGTAGFVAGMAGGLLDPLNLIGFGGGLAARALTRSAFVFRSAAIGAGGNLATTALLQPFIHDAREYRGSDYTAGDVLADLSVSALFGAAFGAAGAAWATRGGRAWRQPAPRPAPPPITEEQLDAAFAAAGDVDAVQAAIRAQAVGDGTTLPRPAPPVPDATGRLAEEPWRASPDDLSALELDVTQAALDLAQHRDIDIQASASADRFGFAVEPGRRQLDDGEIMRAAVAEAQARPDFDPLASIVQRARSLEYRLGLFTVPNLRPKVSDTHASRDAKGRPRSLLAYLKSAGGLIDDGDELKAMDLNRSRPGMVNSRGMTLEDAAVAAGEAGYLHEYADEIDSYGRPSIRALLAGIADELAGDRRFARQDLEDVRAAADAAEAAREQEQLADHIAELERWAKENNTDADAATIREAGIRAIVNRSDPIEELDALLLEQMDTILEPEGAPPGSDPDGAPPSAASPRSPDGARGESSTAREHEDSPEIEILRALVERGRVSEADARAFIEADAELARLAFLDDAAAEAAMCVIGGNP